MEKELRNLVKQWRTVAWGRKYIQDNRAAEGICADELEQLLRSQGSESRITGTLLRECCDMGEVEPVNIASFWDRAAARLREALANEK